MESEADAQARAMTFQVTAVGARLTCHVSLPRYAPSGNACHAGNEAGMAEYSQKCNAQFVEQSQSYDSIET